MRRRCVKCGDWIPPARLALLPETTTCTAHSTEAAVTSDDVETDDHRADTSDITGVPKPDWPKPEIFEARLASVVRLKKDREGDTP